MGQCRTRDGCCAREICPRCSAAAYRLGALALVVGLASRAGEQHVCHLLLNSTLWCIELRPSGGQSRGLRPSEGRHRVPAGGAGRRPGWQRGGWRGGWRVVRWRPHPPRWTAGGRVADGEGGGVVGPRQQATSEGAAVVVKRAAAPLHVVEQALLLGLQLLIPLLQLPLLLQQPSFQPPRVLVLLPHLLQPRLEVLGLPEECVAGA